ncbi:MAG: SET domain-containing protein [Burkholderiales bacterium]
MMLVPVKLDRSPNHGMGVFATRFIPSGTEVWRFMAGFDLDLDPALVEAQPAHIRKVLMHYGYIDSRLRRYILCCDDARFMNHSDDPNTRSDSSTDSYGVDIAVRDIAEGEEITTDYGLMDGQRPA